MLNQIVRLFLCEDECEEKSLREFKVVNSYIIQSQGSKIVSRGHYELCRRIMLLIMLEEAAVIEQKQYLSGACKNTNLVP